MKKKIYNLLIEYCSLKQFPFAILNTDERNIIIDTLGFQRFKLNRKFRLLWCQLGIHKFEADYYRPSDFKGYYNNLVWGSCSRCKYCKKLK